MGKAMQITLAKLTKFWNKWEIHSMILFSLCLQIVLTLMGNRRKYSTSKKLSIGLWLAYQLQDGLLLLSLSVLHQNELWTPFFLLHLGGPDTITSYSLEDNELWGRYNAKFISYLVLGSYAYLQVSTEKVPYFVVFPMFIAGGIKTVERIIAMRSASTINFKASTFRRPDPGPNYARYMEEYCLKKDEGFEVKFERFKETPIVGNLPVPKPSTLQVAYNFFKNYKLPFAGLDLSKQDKVESKSFFQQVASFEEAFNVIEVELGFMYDLFYTKAFQIYSPWGGFLRLISFSCMLSVLLAFLTSKNQAYSTADVRINYVLVGGAIVLEIYAVLVLLTSDWTMLWLSKHKNSIVDLLFRVISSIPILAGNKRCSNTIAQYNLIRYCLEEKPNKCSVSLGIDKLLELLRSQDSVDVSMDLKKLIFDHLREKSAIASNTMSCWELCACRGNRVLKNESCLDVISKEDRKTLEESVEVEFDQSILLWHIATNLSYNSDRNTTPDSVNWPTSCEASKSLSDYMLYLLVKFPVMLPNAIEKIRFQDTCAEANEFFEERSISDVNEACTKLLQVSTKISPSEVKGDTSKSVLFDGCRLAKSLQALNFEKRWELISHVWVEMLCYAAIECQWNYHAKQLTQGGELLTHVWLLMAHFGINKAWGTSSSESFDNDIDDNDIEVSIITL